MGKDGDLDVDYEKVIFLDADIVALKNIDDLFGCDCPGGIINECKTNCIDQSDDRKTVFEWQWHRIYKQFPTRSKLPKEITDRVLSDFKNMGVNGAVIVFEPDYREFLEIMDELENEKTKPFIHDLHWPEMQYLTYRWSGKWHNVDIKYGSFNGYPRLEVLHATHYTGIKPWFFKKNRKAVYNLSKFDDFLYWYNEFLIMLEKYPKLAGNNRLMKLSNEVKTVLN